MANFEEAFEITIKNETGGDPDGGYTNDRDDAGGETKWGICKKYHPSLDIKNLTKEDAEEIYRNEYWGKIKGDKINSQKIANKFFDTAVSPIGSNRAVIIMQISINFLRKKMGMAYISQDGVVGDETVLAINMCNSDMLLSKFKELVVKRYIDMRNPKYEKGWIKRAES